MAANSIIVCGKFLVKFEIGYGGFGVIFLAENIETHQPVAIKYEFFSRQKVMLIQEYEFLNMLNDEIGFPKIHYFKKKTHYNLFVMDLLGPSLENLFNFCKRQFSLKTILMINEQMIKRLEVLHARGIIHRDIKPNNMLMGNDGNKDILYLIDFGLSKLLCDNTMSENNAETTKYVVGTLDFLSINANSYGEQSYRDDMESLSYVMVYFHCGNLPWHGITAQTVKQKIEKFYEKKISIAIHELCKGLPMEFATYLNYCRNIGFDTKPNYQYLQKLFGSVFISLKFTRDLAYDWKIEAQKHTTYVELNKILKKNFSKSLNKEKYDEICEWITNENEQVEDEANVK